MPFFPVFAHKSVLSVCFVTGLGARPVARKCLEFQYLAGAQRLPSALPQRPGREKLTTVGQGNSRRIAWMAITAHSGDRSRPAIGGMRRRNGRSTGSHTLASTDCSGE